MITVLRYNKNNRGKTPVIFVRQRAFIIRITNGMKIFRTAICILSMAVIMNSLCVWAESNDGKAVSSGEYRIGPENAILIEVYYGRDRNLSRKVRVSSDGFITFPLLGKVEVKGLTVSELENELTTLLAKDYLVNPQVSAFIEEYSTVSILGQVKDPGAYPIKGKLSLVELISMAKGFTKIANTNGVKIIRTNPDGSKQTITVRVNDIINKGKEEEDVRLEPGDIVTVPESFF